MKIMGYVVLHLDKSLGNEAAMTDHIERNIIHPNVDPTRTHLNKELIEFPEGVKDRTEAIQRRLETAGLGRQIGKNQVHVIRIMLTGTQEDMHRIQNEGRLDEWCRDNMDYLKKTFGEENLVAATLHMDETSPHIHASVVPIVRGERRKKKSNKKQSEEMPKRQYKKKDPNKPRLCADDVMTRDKLTKYQDTYAEAMQKYGLERGIKGSEVRHITATEYHRSLSLETKDLQTNIDLLFAEEDAKRKRIEELRQHELEAKQKFIQAEELKRQKELELKKTEENLNQIKGQLKTEELKNRVADVGFNIMDGIGSMIGTSKVKRQQQEIESLKEEKENLIQEVKTLKLDMQTTQKEHETALDKLKQEVKKIHDLFLHIRELLRVENLCKVLRFSEELIKLILQCKPVGFKGELYSPEFKRGFKTEYSEVKVEEEPKQTGKFRLLIDNLDPTDWFRKKQREFLESIRIKQSKQEEEIGKSNGFRM
jgi:hypothetical protein